MRWQTAIGALVVVAASTELGFAADPRYPDWPCTQAKVSEISLAAVWAGPPLDDIKDKWKDDTKVSALVPKLAARRTAPDCPVMPPPETFATTLKLAVLSVASSGCRALLRCSSVTK